MKLVFKILGGLVAALLLFVIVIYVAADPKQPVPATVVDDPTLPAIEVGGVRLHAEAFGPDNAPLVVVLHGGPGNDYRGLLSLKALSDSYRVVFYDQRGAGLSERVPAEKLTIDAYIAELDGVARHFGADQPIHLVGHSWGAMLATAYTARHPERVVSAFLAEPGFLTSDIANDFMERTNGMRPPFSFGMLSHLLSTAFEAWKLDGPDDDAGSDYLMLHLVIDANTEGHPMAGYFCDGDMKNANMDAWRFGTTAMMAVQRLADDDGNISVDFTTGLERFDGPVMILASSCNVLIGAEHQKQHLAFFQRARMQVIEGAGHTMFGEKPSESTAIVRSFLDPLVAPPIDTAAPEASAP